MIKRIFTIIVLSILSTMMYAQTPSTSYTVPTISQLQSYYGRADRVYVVEKNQDYIICSPCTVNDSTVLSGAGGRKWKHISDSSKLSYDDQFTGNLEVLLSRNYPNDSIAINDGQLKLGDLYQTDGAVKVVVTQYVVDTSFRYTIDNTDGSANTYHLRLDANTPNLVSASIDWGDGTDTVLTGDIYYELNHTYDPGNSYTVKIAASPSNNLNKLNLNNSGSPIKITSIRNIQSLTTLKRLSVEFSQILQVDTLSFPSSVTELSFQDAHLTSFQIEKPLALTFLNLTGCWIESDSAIYLPPTLTYLGMSAMSNHLHTQSWNATDVNNFLIRLDALTFNAGPKTLDIVQFNNAVPSGAGLAAKTSLQSKGWTINTD